MPERFVPRAEVRALSGYTTQLVAGYQEDTALTFIRRYPELEGLRYTRSQRNGQDWFVVYLGRFEQQEAARASIAELPSSIRSQQPWIRALEDI
jgi:DamX protein